MLTANNVARRAGLLAAGFATCTLAAILSIAAPVTLGLSESAVAMGEAPQPVVDCRKRKNRDKPQCKPRNSDAAANNETAAAELTDDQIYASAYALAQMEKYKEARELLLTARDQSAARILNYLGYTSRKLGETDVAIGYYKRALDVQPDYAQARSYYGEALVEKGDVSAAEAQLAEIRSICGTTCDAYVRLDARLKAARG